jgi:hypothetical protein
MPEMNGLVGTILPPATVSPFVTLVAHFQGMDAGNED